MAKKEIKKSTALLAILTILMLVVVGCTSQSTIESESPQTTENVEEDFPDEPLAPGEVEVQVADPRPEEEQMQESLATAIADGTYTERLTYAYHSGTEDIDVSITLVDEIITEISVLGAGNNHPTSDRLIRAVDAGLQEMAVGVNIHELDIPDRISGSSLTTAAVKGFVEDLRNA
ncbi:MAG: hypothetical protein ACMXYK_02860 [Candidatus Woesearchaeota archaeon]